jgi:exopolysaccharide production protein ExoQ
LKLQALKNFGEKLEPWIVGVLLLYFFGLDAPPLIVKIMKVGSYPIVFFLIVGRLQRFAYFATRDISLLLLVGMAMISVFWSAAPDFTSIETKAVLRATLFGVYLAMRFSIKEQMKLLAWVLGIGAVFSLLFALAMPSYGIHVSGDEGTVGAWKGIFSFKNLFASLMTLGALLFLLIALDERKKRWLSWGLFGLSVVLLFLSQGKTAYSVFFISLSLLPFHKFVKQHDKLRVFFMLIAILVTGSAIVLVLSNLEFIVVDTLGKNMEFNGRMPIWTLIFNKILERPWLGYGLSGFWTSDEALYVLYNSWGEIALESGTRFNAHSGYLDLGLALGFLGFFLYVFNFLALFTRTVNLWMATRSIEFFWIIQVLVIFLLLNFTDSISILGIGSTWSIYVSMAISTAVQQTRMRKQRKLSKVPVAG